MTKWWKVTFLKGKEGRINSIEPCAAPDAAWAVGGGSMYVQAVNEDAARKVAYNFYCARKKKEAIKKKHDRGQCCCGRNRDRPHPAKPDEFLLTCTTCADRRHAQYERGPTFAPRDEAKRIQALQGRVRDRKNEIRLEVLCEVRKQWEMAPNVGAFTKWLKSQIDECLIPRVAQ